MGNFKELKTKLLGKGSFCNNKPFYGSDDQNNRWSDRKTKVVKFCRVTVNSVLSRMSVNFHSLHGRGKCKIWGLIHISHVKPRSVIHMLKVWYTSTEPRSYSLVHLHWRYKSDHRLICISLRALSF